MGTTVVGQQENLPLLPSHFAKIPSLPSCLEYTAVCIIRVRNKRSPLYLQLRTRTHLIDLYPYFNTHFTCIFSYLEFDNCSILQFFFHFVLVVFSTNIFCKPQQW